MGGPAKRKSGEPHSQDGDRKLSACWRTQVIRDQGSKPRVLNSFNFPPSRCKVGGAASSSSGWASLLDQGDPLFLVGPRPVDITAAAAATAASSLPPPIGRRFLVPGDADRPDAAALAAGAGVQTASGLSAARPASPVHTAAARSTAPLAQSPESLAKAANKLPAARAGALFTEGTEFPLRVTTKGAYSASLSSVHPSPPPLLPSCWRH